MKWSKTFLSNLVATVSITFGLATTFSWYNYKSYWHGTIRRVQTIDFNILSHILPTKLSYLLIHQDIEELQLTLNSNYGYFGIVVTDCSKPESEPECPDQNILYSTDAESIWKQELNTEKLSALPYNVLKNPPPILTESEFTSSRDEVPKSTGKINPGKVIGRVYYVRGVPPTFRADLFDWLKKFPGSLITESGGDKFYTLTFGLFLFLGAATLIGIDFFLYRKRKQLEEKIYLKEEIKKLKNQWNQSESRLTYQISVLNREKEKSQTKLRQHQQEKQCLKDELTQIKSELHLSQSQQQQQIEEARKNNSEAEAKLILEKQKILKLEQLILEQSQQQQRDEEKLQQLKQELAKATTIKSQLKQEISNGKDYVSNLQTQIIFQKENYQQQITLKEQKIAQAQQELIKTQEKSRQLHDSIEKLEAKKNDYEQKNQALTQQLESMSKQTQLQRNEIEKLKQFQADYDYQQQELVDYVDSEQRRLEEQIKNLEQELAQVSEITAEKERLLTDYTQLQLHCAELEDELAELRQNSGESCRQPKKTKKIKQALKFGTKRLILVGGHQKVCGRVFEILCTNNDLNNYDYIPPSSEGRVSTKEVKAKIENADLVAVITGYIGHDLSGIVDNLKSRTRGETIRLNSRGSSGIVEEIKEYLVKQPIK